MLTSKAWGMFNQLVIHASTLYQKEKPLSLESITTKVNETKSALSQQFDVKDLGELTVRIGQPTFTETTLQKYDMGEAKPVETPVSVNSKLLKAMKECEVVVYISLQLEVCYI